MPDLKCASCHMPLTGGDDVKCSQCEANMTCDESECKCGQCGNTVKASDAKCVHCLGKA